MNARTFVVGIAGLALAAVAGYGLYTYGMNRGMEMAAATPKADGRPVLYWHDPMVPGSRFDKPGKSPYMDMQLVPVYADDAAAQAPGVRIDPAVQQNLGMRTATVTRARLASRVEAVGNVAYDEREVALVQARANGYIERLDVKAPLDAVRKGQVLAELYVPDWIATQEEYLTARRLSATTPGIEEAAMQRMRLAGMSEAQVEAVKRDGHVQPRVPIVAPIAGVVSELSARQGMTVANGAPLFRINGISTVWVLAQVPEGMAAAVRPGTRAEVTVAAFPGEDFHGRVTALLPEVDPATRTLRARVEVTNPKARLTPGMFARVAFAPSDAREVLTVPTEAVIRTGTRTLVMIAGKDGRFEPLEVQTGADSGGRTEIRGGLSEGDKVVASGQFLLDSEAKIRR